MLDWVQSDNAGKIIQSSDIIKWLIQTPYIRFRNERLFLEAVAEHNKVIWAREARDRVDLYSRSQIELNSCSVGADFITDTFGIEDLRNE